MHERWSPGVVAIHIGIFLAYVIALEVLCHPRLNDLSRLPVGLTFTQSIVTLLRLLPLLSLPFAVLNFVGLMSSPLRLPQLEFETSTKGFTAPFLCFRVVTRGLFPDLVADNVQRNLDTCYKLGLENFIIEVVTDHAVQIPAQQRTREIVVPDSYSPPRGAKFKARALQYCLEPEVNILNDQDWIIHLDEETILTENAVKGVFNFASAGRHHFGQGVITYTNLGIQNTILTLVDSVRVGVDYGLIRYQFTKFNLPLFSMKGSFVVANAGAERQVTWDWGEEGSIAEDAFFALAAMSQGFKFDFIPAEMWECSPFTFGDYLKQRGRWLKGLQKLLWTTQVPHRVKAGIALNATSWTVLPLSSVGVVLSHFVPAPFPLLDLFLTFLTINFVTMMLVGTALSFNPKRIGLLRYCGYLALTVVALPVLAIGENLTSVLNLFEKRVHFEIVQKDRSRTQGSETAQIV